MDKIKIAVCGDSFCAANTQNNKSPGSYINGVPIGLRAHFAHILEDQYSSKYEMLHLAHGGMGNTAIVFQMREAILAKVDVVVYNKTWSSRVNVAMHDNFYLDNGLRNFVYYNPHHPATGTELVGNMNAPVVSTVHQNLKNSPFFDFSKQQLTAVDLYIKHLLCCGLQETIDDWLFDYWREKIIAAGILPIFFNDTVGKIAYEFSAKYPDLDCSFHTDRATQEAVAANIDRYIEQHRKL